MMAQHCICDNDGAAFLRGAKTGAESASSEFWGYMVATIIAPA